MAEMGAERRRSIIEAMTARPKHHRLRPVTRALLWYPAVCLLIAAAFALLVWIDCGSLKAVERCRSEIAGETAWVFGIVLVIGSVVLGVLWLVTYPIAARRARGIAEGFDQPRPDTTTATAGEEHPTDARDRPSPARAEETGAADPVRPARAARHGSPGAGRPG
jgi:hypothetical protein